MLLYSFLLVHIRHIALLSGRQSEGDNEPAFKCSCSSTSRPRVVLTSVYFRALRILRSFSEVDGPSSLERRHKEVTFCSLLNASSGVGTGSVGTSVELLLSDLT